MYRHTVTFFGEKLCQFVGVFDVVPNADGFVGSAGDNQGLSYTHIQTRDSAVMDGLGQEFEARFIALCTLIMRTCILQIYLDNFGASKSSEIDLVDLGAAQ